MLESIAHGEALTPKRAALLEVLKDAAYGDLYTHEALHEIMQEPPFSTRYHHLVGSVKRQLERTHSRTLTPVRGKGYRLALPKEHVDLAQKEHRSARRKLRRSISVNGSANEALLLPDELHRKRNNDAIYRQQLHVLQRRVQAAEHKMRKAEEHMATTRQQEMSGIRTLVDEFLHRLQETFPH